MSSIEHFKKPPDAGSILERYANDYLNLFRSNFKELERIEPPKDLEGLVAQSREVLRYVYREYPQGIFDDNVEAHTKRCVWLADVLPLESVLKQKLKRTLWLHDLAEIETQEYTIIEKEIDQNLAEHLAHLEKDFIVKNFRKNDQKFMENFHKAGEYLKKPTSYSELSEEALVAVVIDQVDNNLCFHYYLSTWSKSKQYNPRLSLPNLSLVYTFNKYNQFKDKLKLRNGDERLKQAFSVCHDLLDWQIRMVDNVWSKVGPDRVPEPIKQKLKYFKIKK